MGEPGSFVKFKCLPFLLIQIDIPGLHCNIQAEFCGFPTTIFELRQRVLKSLVCSCALECNIYIGKLC